MNIKCITYNVSLDTDLFIGNQITEDDINKFMDYYNIEMIHDKKYSVELKNELIKLVSDNNFILDVLFKSWVIAIIDELDVAILLNDEFVVTAGL